MDIVRFTTSEGHIDVTSRQLAGQTSCLTDIQLITYALQYFGAVYNITNVQSVEIIAR
jgi:hypothetical protein